MDLNNSEKTNIIKILLDLFLPPPAFRIPVIILSGIFAGLSLYVFYISNAISYLSDDPKTCVNCHVMAPQFSTWEHGSHARDATCNDCHVPHDNFFRKYLFKMKDGLRHASIFTLRLEPQVIFIKDAGKEVVQENCIRCHSNLISPISLRSLSNKNIMDGRTDHCWSCHRETPHGRVNSLASTPFAKVPQLSTFTPDWIGTFIKSKNQK